jgi:hypothetical protein
MFELDDTSGWFRAVYEDFREQALARIMAGHPPGEVRESMYRGLDAMHEIARRAVDNAIASYETGAGDDVDQVVAEFVERYPPREA